MCRTPATGSPRWNGHLGSGPAISEAQATELTRAVKAVSQQLERNGDQASYQKVYGELYGREGISTYRNLPAARYKEVTTWLHTWYREIAPPTADDQAIGST